MADNVLIVKKKNLRSRIQKIKISDPQKKQASLRVCQKIQKTSFFRDAKTIGFYAAAQDEIDLFPLVEKALNLGKKIYFPRIQRGRIEFRQVQNVDSDFRIGTFKIREPHPKRTVKRIRPLDLILVPGRAFDARGARLGRGGGYYDRLLAKWRSSVRLGVAFRKQKVKSIPVLKHDIHMDAVITG